MNYKKSLPGELKKRLKRLYPLEETDKVFEKYVKKWLIRLGAMLGGVVLLMLVLLFSVRGESVLQEGNVIKRPAHNETAFEVEVNVEMKESEWGTEALTLQIEPEKYTLSEFENLIKETIPELEQRILGENLALDSITEDLILPEYLMDTPIAIRWESDDDDRVSRTGKVNQDIAKEEDGVVLLTAIFTYEEYKMSHTIGLRVKSKELSVQERLRKNLFAELERAFNASREEEKVVLPKEIDGMEVVYTEEKEEKGKGIIFFLVATVLIWGIALKEELEGMEKRREQQLLLDYPGLISQFTLLLSAGMTITGAWKKMLEQYENHKKAGNKRQRYLYEEMTITWREIQNGVSEVDAIGRFGTRIRLPPYLKFSTLLSQNLRKGSRGLISLLKVEEKLAYEDRKEMAKQLGEEAGTRLLIPMFMMFGIVLAVVLIPAFSNF